MALRRTHGHKTMRNENKWTPTKFCLYNGELRSSVAKDQVSVGSRFVTELTAKFYAEEIPRRVSGVVLDLGCGKAPLYAAYKEFASEIICIDWEDTVSSDSYLDYSADLNEKIPLPDRSVDTIILSDVLEHIFRPASLFSEMYRVLRPGGTILCNVPFYYWIHASPHDFHRYTRNALERYCSESGLSLVELRETGGAIDVMTDLLAKFCAPIPIMGKWLSRLIQFVWLRCYGTRIWRRAYYKTKDKFPFGYSFVATRDAEPS